MKVLLIADDEQEESILLGVLQLAGFATAVAPGMVDSVEPLPLDGSAHVVVMAVTCAEPVDIVRQLRFESDAPLIVIVDPVTERLHAQLIDEGADYLFTRPLSMRLLVAYCRALLRRMPLPLSPTIPEAYGRGAFRGAVQLEPTRRTVQVAGSPPQRLSQLEYRLLHTLISNQGQVIPTETIVERVWGYNGEGDRSLVRGLINRLRAKIEVNPENPHYIRTIARIGYMFSEGDDAA